MTEVLFCSYWVTTWGRTPDVSVVVSSSGVRVWWSLGLLHREKDVAGTGPWESLGLKSYRNVRTRCGAGGREHSFSPPLNLLLQDSSVSPGVRTRVYVRGRALLWNLSFSDARSRRRLPTQVDD